MEEIGNSLAMALVLCKSKKRFLPTNISPWRDFSWPATYAGLEGRDSVADGNGAGAEPRKARKKWQVSILEEKWMVERKKVPSKFKKNSMERIYCKRGLATVELPYESDDCERHSRLCGFLRKDGGAF